MNPVTSTALVTIEGKEFGLRFTLAALAELQTIDPEFKLMGQLDLLPKYLAIGLRHQWQEVTAEKLSCCVIPVIPAWNALAKAINLALHGTEEAPKASPLDKEGESPTGAQSSAPQQRPDYLHE